ncbi:MAG: hypothetical protein NTW87_06665 [Planctomycetota bacterium]|nr:hypothetical protein [Planctomycetota bacterium]
MTKRRLGELLQAEGLISEEQVRQALVEQRKSSIFLGEALVKLGFVSETAIAQTIVQQFSLPFMSAQMYTITPDILNVFHEQMYYEYQFIAVDKIGKTLIIIGAGLMNHDVIDELERLSGCKVCQYVSTWADIRAALERHAKELRKEQLELSSLGSMLLDSTPAPEAVPPPPPPAAAAVARPAAPPAAPASVPLRPGLSAAASRTMPAAAGATPPGGVVRAGPATSSVRPGPATSSVRGTPPAGSSSALRAIPAGQMTTRLSALAPKAGPAKTSNPGVPAVLAPEAPAAPAPNANPAPPPPPPPPPPPKPGLLGLLKKQ